MVVTQIGSLLHSAITHILLGWQLEKHRSHFWLYLSYTNILLAEAKVAMGGGGAETSPRHYIVREICKAYCRSIKQCYIAVTLNNGCIVYMDFTQQTPAAWSARGLCPQQ